jgi:SOS response regulatory protein OraA/RecX
MDEIYTHALKLLRARDYSVESLRQKLDRKFGAVPQDVIDQLIQRNFLKDRRFAENYVARRKKRGEAVLRHELSQRGVGAELIEQTLSQNVWPSLQAALKAKMDGWNLRHPLQPRDAGRLFRALLRLGYEEDAIRGEIAKIHEE